MSKKLLIFDLDGTLVDSSSAIISTIQETLKQSGIEENNIQILRSFIGPTLTDTYGNYYGLSDEKLQNALILHKNIFKKNGIIKNTLYEGVAEFLQRVRKNAKLTIATTKYTEDAQEILTHTNLEIFDMVLGADDTMVGSDKTHLVKQIIEKYPSISKDEIVMIGDRKFDIIAAQNCGIDSVAVLWGFGSKEELNASNPTYIVKTIKELEQLV